MEESFYKQLEDQTSKDLTSVLTPRELIYRHMHNPCELITDEDIQNLKLDIYEYKEVNSIKRSWRN